MYQIINSLCLSRSTGAQWEELDLSSTVVKNIFEIYYQVYLTIYNTVLDVNIYVDMNTLRSEFSNYDNTLSVLLIELENRTLDTVESIPSTNVKYVKYSDAIRANYKIELTVAGQVLPDNYPISDMKDIEIKRPNYDTDMSLLHDYCLITVNGFVHNTDTDGTRAYVYDAVKTLNKSRSNHIGILSFLDVGSLDKIKINKDNILPLDETSSLKDKIYFSVEEDLNNKSYILILGGYMIFPDENIFWRSGEHTFALNLNLLPYVERIYESNYYIDLSDLELTTNPINDTMINTDELWSDEVIKKYMTLTQSFLVLVDTDKLINRKISLRSCNLPGLFTSYIDPTYPLFVNYGKIAEYWKVLEDGHWSVSVQDSFLKNYILSEQPIQQLENITSNLLPNKPFRHSRGFLLEIAGYNL